MRIQKSKTIRGFALREFQDRNDRKCSLQKSSLATEQAIWLGLDSADPKVMAREADLAGVMTKQTTGWIPYPIPDVVQLSTRMHLTQAQVKKLLPILQHFVDTGELP